MRKTGFALSSAGRPDVAVLSRAWAKAGAWLDHCADLVFPPFCVTCGTAVRKNGAVCPACWAQLRFIAPPFCPVLGLPFARDLGPNVLSAEAIAHPPVFDRLRSATIFEGPARALVHGLKYRDRGELAPMMAAWMLRAAGDLVPQADLVIPLPLHPLRLLARRYNQAGELARHLARLSGRPLLPHGLVRVRNTRRQVGLGVAARAENVRGAFRVRPVAQVQIAGKRVILIDDVYTTGATVSAATRALKRAGASDVTVLTFARALAGPI